VLPKGQAEESETPLERAKVGEMPVMNPLPASPGATVGEGIGGADSPGLGGRGGAGQSDTGLLRAPAAARRVVYVIDRSVSMGVSGALAFARHEVLAGIEALPDDARFAVIFYNRQAELLSPDGQTGLVTATAANRAATARLLDDVPASGDTDHLAGLRRALALSPDVIFLVTDADNMTADQVRNAAILNRSRAAIHAVQLSRTGEQDEQSPLAQLARLTGGTHRVVMVKR
jgi:von Willebrand factor type A domain